jgi:hypothetical protein
MTILLEWLVDRAWLLYAGCGLACVIYLFRAYSAHRQGRLSQFTLERETSTARVVEYSVAAAVFAAVGVLLFAGVQFASAQLSDGSDGRPGATPTMSAGVEVPTPTSTAIPTSIPQPLVPTFAPQATTQPVPTLGSGEATDTPEPTATEVPSGVSGELNVGFGDVALLASYSLPADTVSPTGTLQLVLYWQALPDVIELDYLVFTHLVSEDGRLIAQHDGQPAGGSRPTSGWSPGETIVDPHPMAFTGEAVQGVARIWVGFYDQTRGRVLTGTGDDHVEIPTAITVVP